jgi:hypothetical protein
LWLPDFGVVRVVVYYNMLAVSTHVRQ